MNTIEAYREAILKAMLNVKDADGLGIVTEKAARQLLAELTDEELEDGIDFNTPEEVAAWLLEP